MMEIFRLIVVQLQNVKPAQNLSESIKQKSIVIRAFEMQELESVTSSKLHCLQCSTFYLLCELPFYAIHLVSPTQGSSLVQLNDSTLVPYKHTDARKSNNKHLSVMNLNTQCMTSNIGVLSLLINDYQFDIATLRETWFKDNSLLLLHACFFTWIPVLLQQQR